MTGEEKRVAKDLSGVLAAKLLVVDDEEEIRQVLQEYLTAKGYRVSTARDGVQALEVIERDRPSLVLLDVRLPGMSGVELLQKIRSLDPEVGVIMLTGNDDVELARRTLKLGAFDYVRKPFDLNDLGRSIFTQLVAGVADEAPEAGSGERDSS